MVQLVVHGRYHTYIIRYSHTGSPTLVGQGGGEKSADGGGRGNALVPVSVTLPQVAPVFVKVQRLGFLEGLPEYVEGGP